MNREMEKGWELTQERAKDIYELLMNSLDPSTWEVLIKSENQRMQLGEFIEKARKRIIYRPEFSSYNPQVVADDALNILDSMNVTFDQLRNRMEDAFRSILVANEWLNEYVGKKDEKIEDSNAELEAIKEENNQLREQVAQLKEELDNKMQGITPLTDVINIRIKEIIKLYDEFKECVGDEERMKGFIPVFEKEVESTIKLIEMKRKQVLESNIKYPKLNEVFKDDEKGFVPPSEEDYEEIPDENAVFPGGEDETLDIPPRFREEPELYKEAVNIVKRKSHWNDGIYEAEILQCINDIKQGKKYKPSA